MTEKKLDTMSLGVAKFMVLEAHHGNEAMIEPENYKVAMNQDCACIAQQMFAEEQGIVNEEATEEPVDVAAPMQSFEASEGRDNTSVPVLGGAF